MLALVAAALYGPLAANSTPLSNPVTPDVIDASAFRAWTGGVEQPVYGGGGATPTALSNPDHILWTTASRPQWDGARYGLSKVPDIRYMRLGFTRAIPVGSVLVRGGGSMSYLKPKAAYPGRIAVDDDWAPAWRIKDGAVSTTEVGGEEYALWVLPAGVSTRALRFSHTPSSSDETYAGTIGGVTILSARMSNIAAFAQAVTSSNDDHAGKINDQLNDGTWGAWDNGEHGSSHAISSQNPEYVSLIWPNPVALSGLIALWAGFADGDVQTYTGTGNPGISGDTEWRIVKSFNGFQNYYPMQLGPNWIEFASPITTRAIRLRITAPTDESHPHLAGKTYGGKRIWLGELFALSPLGDSLLATTLPPKPTGAAVHPPIPVRFHLDKPGYVTLVVDDSRGIRVRNLISETPFPAGDNVAWWDGLDDLGRDSDASSHAIYYIPGKMVAGGTYRVCGLVRDAIDLRYQMAVNTHGSPAWQTQDPSSQWLANHTPPSTALFIPESDTGLTPPGRTVGGEILIGSYVTEGGSGLAWLDTNGNKKNGVGWIGGNWTGAEFLARDSGMGPAPDNYAYVGSAFDSQLRLTALTKSGDKPLITPPIPLPVSTGDAVPPEKALKGIAAYGGLLVASMGVTNCLMFIDTSGHKVLGSAAVDDPRGVAFDAQGRLLVLSGTRLLRYILAADRTKLPSPAVVVAKGLDDPQQMTLDASGQIYVSDHGQSDQVKVFSVDGTLVRVIGHPGAPGVGPYDPEHMNNPAGLTIDGAGRLWVAENDFQPKRVSVWSPDGKLVNAFYGPALYGGGGDIDPHNPELFNYCGMTFHLDYATGDSKPVSIFYRPNTDDASSKSTALAGPQTPLYAQGREYLTNAFNDNPTNGASVATLWLLDRGVARAVAALGVANQVELLKTDAFKARWPAGVDLTGNYWTNQAMFLWVDQNGDGKMQPAEIVMVKKTEAGVTVMPDLSFVVSRMDDVSMRFAPTGFSSDGVPQYNMASGKVLLTGAQGPVSSGGDQTSSVMTAGRFARQRQSPSALLA